MYKSIDYEVPPRSWHKISYLAGLFRRELQLSDVQYFPVMEFIEHILPNMKRDFHLRIADKKELGNVGGLTDPQGKFIVLREDIYRDAYDGNGRARFTVAHEFAHLFLHTNLPLQRVIDSHEIPAYRSSERQADQFAAELLMPRSGMPKFKTPEEIAKCYKVSLQAAKVRMKTLNIKSE
ncbi:MULTISPECIES: ImmA/IrrE family metallo-endopeptidase [unclassified Bartonella]|uniref:ImmA/IrrE family metallo-endopeptidase n=1 Tax=unclassified Bartonella TaxID=2645622 RepID=UPI0035D0F3C1